MPVLAKARLLKKGLVLGGCLALGNVWAGGSETAPVYVGLPAPGISLYGLGGNGWTAFGDVMLPAFGHPDSFIYVDPQIYYHTSEAYSGSFGAGYRGLVDNTTGILGAYVFGDYNRTPDDHDFWFVSPGIERLGQILDFSANAYIPVTKQRINTGTTFAENVGDSSQIIFSGHDQVDALVNTFTSTGYGGDVQIGVHLPFFRNSEVYLGGYYFAPKDTDDIGGGSVRLQVPVNRYASVLVSEAYDSEYHNTFKAGLTLWFGGRSTGYGFSGNLAERLVDPIQRGLVFVAGGSKNLEPSVSDFENTGETALVKSNISFFVPDAAGGPQGDGTYENPYIGITQDNVNNANAQDNRTFYVDSGTYNPVYAPGNDYIILNNDQVFGRQSDFREDAQGSNRPWLQFASGGFEVPAGDVNDSFTGLQLTGANVDGRAGIWINHDGSPVDLSVTIDNSSVKSFGDGIDILNAGPSQLTVNLKDTLVSDNNGTGELFSPFGVTGGIGVMNDLGSTGLLKINMKNTTVQANNKSFSDQELVAAGGMAAVNMGSAMEINIDSSAFIDNVITANNTNMDAAGGLAIANVGGFNTSPAGNNNSDQEEVREVTLNAKKSTFSNNSIALDGGAIDSIGGLAVDAFDILGEDVTDASANTMLNISKSNFSNNSITAAGSMSVLTAGGLAANISAGASDMTLNVNDSAFNSNSIINNSENSGFINVAGGLAGRNSGATFGRLSNLTLNLSDSDFSNNLMSITAGSNFNAAGGVAISDVGANAGDTLTMNLSHSTLLNNTIFDNDGNIEVAGGLAVRGDNGTIVVNVDSSDISNNTVSVENNARVQAAGGVAQVSHTGISSGGTGSLTMTVDNLNITGNTVNADQNSTIIAAGGLASYDDHQSSLVQLDVSNSNISENSINADNNSVINAAGGLAIGYDVGVSNLLLNVNNSCINNNSISANNSSSMFAAGGVAFYNGSILSNATLNISNSNITNNTVMAANGAHINVAGGLAIYNNSVFVPDLPNNVVVNIDQSNISHNTVTTSDGGVIDIIGGVAAQNINTTALNTLTINIANSKLIDNSGSGVAVDVVEGPTPPLVTTTVNIDKSIIKDNEIFGLSATGGSVISVTNPIFFKGMVNVQGGSIITFPDIGPLTSNAFVLCPKAGPCTIVTY